MNQLRRIPENVAWWCFVMAARWWAARYLDQWDKVKFDTAHGEVYLSIGRSDPYPDSYDKVR